MSAPYEHADYVRQLVDAAPPLTAEQRARIAILMRGARTPAAPVAVPDAA